MWECNILLAIRSLSPSNTPTTNFTFYNSKLQFLNRENETQKYASFESSELFELPPKNKQKTKAKVIFNLQTNRVKNLIFLHDIYRTEKPPEAVCLLFILTDYLTLLVRGGHKEPELFQTAISPLKKESAKKYFFSLMNNTQSKKRIG